MQTHPKGQNTFLFLCTYIYTHTPTHSRYYLYLKYPGILRQNSMTHLSDDNALEIQDRSMTKGAKIPTPEPADRQERWPECEHSEMLWKDTIYARDSAAGTVLLKIH